MTILWSLLLAQHTDIIDSLLVIETDARPQTGDKRVYDPRPGAVVEIQKGAAVPDITEVLLMADSEVRPVTAENPKGVRAPWLFLPVNV